MAGEVEITVHRGRCMAAKCCINAAPGVFELDEVRVSTVRNPKGEPLDAILDAAAACPTGAITVTRNGEKLA